MTAVATVAASLLAALGTVDGVRSYKDPGAVVTPPGTVLGPPALTWDALSPEPTSSRWLVYLVERVDERALERLWELLPRVTAALDRVTNAVVVRADPGAYLAGGPELPCYEIQVDVSL